MVNLGQGKERDEDQKIQATPPNAFEQLDKRLLCIEKDKKPG